MHLLFQQRAVGGQCNFYFELGEHLDQAMQMPPHERFAARQADFLHPEADEDARQAGDLLEAEDRLVRQEAVAGIEHLARHAVHAAEVAAIGDRNAQVAHLAPARIREAPALEKGRFELSCLNRNDLLHQGFFPRKIIAERARQECPAV